jgi:hypothetical protein
MPDLTIDRREIVEARFVPAVQVLDARFRGMIAAYLRRQL